MEQENTSAHMDDTGYSYIPVTNGSEEILATPESSHSCNGSGEASTMTRPSILMANGSELPMTTRPSILVTSGSEIPVTTRFSHLPTRDAGNGLKQNGNGLGAGDFINTLIMALSQISASNMNTSDSIHTFIGELSRIREESTNESTNIASAEDNLRQILTTIKQIQESSTRQSSIDDQLRQILAEVVTLRDNETGSASIDDSLQQILTTIRQIRESSSSQTETDDRVSLLLDEMRNLREVMTRKPDVDDRINLLIEEIRQLRGEESCQISSNGVSVGVWHLYEIGTEAIARDEASADGQSTIKSIGTNLIGDSDNFGYRAMSLTGDITMTARVLRMDNTSSDAIAGIQIRETLDEGSPYAMIGWAPQQYAAFLHRDEPNRNANSNRVSNSFSSAPYLWLRLTCEGDLFTGEISTDGITFHNVGSASIKMPRQVYIGLAVTSGDCKPTTAVFDQLQMESKW